MTRSFYSFIVSAYIFSTLVWNITVNCCKRSLCDNLFLISNCLFVCIVREKLPSAITKYAQPSVSIKPAKKTRGALKVALWILASIFWFTEKVNDVHEAYGWCTVLKDAVTRSAETRDADSKVNLYKPLYFFGFVPNNIGMDFKSGSFYLEERTKPFKTIFNLLPFFGIGKYYFFYS